MEAERVNQIENSLKDLGARNDELRGIFDYDQKKDRLEEVVRLTEDGCLEQSQKAQELEQGAELLEGVVLNIDEIAAAVADGLELFEMGKAEEDWDTVVAVEADAAALEKRVAKWNSAACSTIRWIRTTASSTSRLVPVALRSTRLGRHAGTHVSALQ